MIMTFEQIYNQLKEPPTNADERFTQYELIKIFDNESSWVGSSWQLMKLKEVFHQITGIRPGNCSGCNLTTLQDLARWLRRYEAEHPEPEVKEPIFVEPKKTGRPKKY